MSPCPAPAVFQNLSILGSEIYKQRVTKKRTLSMGSRAAPHSGYARLIYGLLAGQDRQQLLSFHTNPALLKNADASRIHTCPGSSALRSRLEPLAGTEAR